MKKLVYETSYERSHLLVSENVSISQMAATNNNQSNTNPNKFPVTW